MLLLHLFLLLLLATGAGTAQVGPEGESTEKTSKFDKFLKFASKLKDIYNYVKTQTKQALKESMSFLPPANPGGARALRHIPSP